MLQGKAKIVLPLKPKEEKKEPSAVAVTPKAAAPVGFSGPLMTTCTVEEDGRTRTFRVTMQPPSPTEANHRSSSGKAVATPGESASTQSVPVFSPFKGKAELVELKVRTGDTVAEGQIVAAVEAMKAKHDVRAPTGGKVISVDVAVGTDVMAGQPILTIGQ